MQRRASLFLLVIAVIFALPWVGQIGSAAITGQQPQALRDAGWPTSLSAVTGIRLLIGRPGALRYAVPLLVFIPVLTFGVLSISVFAALDRQPFDFVQTGIFVVTTVLAGLLASAGSQSSATPAHLMGRATLQPQPRRRSAGAPPVAEART